MGCKLYTVMTGRKNRSWPTDSSWELKGLMTKHIRWVEIFSILLFNLRNRAATKHQMTRAACSDVDFSECHQAVRFRSAVCFLFFRFSVFFPLISHFSVGFICDRFNYCSHDKSSITCQMFPVKRTTSKPGHTALKVKKKRWSMFSNIILNLDFIQSYTVYV